MMLSVRRWSNGGAIPRLAARAAAVAALSATALSMVVLSTVLLTSASAAPTHGWGPFQLPYRTGVVCTDDRGEVALASWPAAATSVPAFALRAVTAGPDGAHAASPAVDATGTAPYDSPLAATLAALLTRHGTSRDQVTTAEVAGAIIAHTAPDTATDRCLAAQPGGTTGAAVLWAAAVRLAGPYTVRLHLPTAKLVMGTAAPLSATVTSASGTPVPGVMVSFATAEPGADFASVGGLTNDRGVAADSLTVQPGTTAQTVRIEVRAKVPGAPVTMTAPARVPLVAAGPTHTIIRTALAPVDTTADPQLHTAVDRALVLPGTAIQPTIAVSGMRGHSGTATLSVSGPLSLDANHSCAAYADGATHSAPTSAVGAAAQPAVDVTGDATVDARPLTLTRPGCYVLHSAIATSDAIPDVHRQGDTTVVAVAPVHVTVAPAGLGVALAGPLSATVSVTGAVPAHLTDVTAALVGPRASNDGSCSGVQLPSNGTALTATQAGRGVRLVSPAVTKTGCYGYRVLATVQIPSLGSVPLAWSGPISATTLVLAPTTTVTGLSASDVVAGGRLSADVSVSGTWTQPGALRLVLKHLPYNWRGCFGRDWTNAGTSSVTGPLLPTTGDGTYRVQTPVVPSDGCWTVVPVLTLSRNKQISLTDTAPIDPMTAFTALHPSASPVAQRVSLGVAGGDGAKQVVGAGAGMIVLLVLAVGWTLSIALRDR